MPEAFHFLRPEWLLCIPLALALAVAWARRARRASGWERRIDPDLLGLLLEAPARGRAGRLPWLCACALAVGALGLAGPTWERLPQPVERQTDALVILLDLSLSMYAADVPPSRIVRARQKIADVLRQRREGLTALVVYAGNAHTVVPLTDDVRTIENLLPALAPDMMPVFGSEVGAAIDLAHELLDNSGSTSGRILLVTDGVDRISDVTERRNRSRPISILGIGTDAGATIPLDFASQPDQVLRTRQGEPILARLDAARLAEIGSIAHGRYRTLALGDEDLAYLLDTPLPGAESTREVERDFDLWLDQGFWAALLLIPALLLAFRRGVLVVLPLGLPIALPLALALSLAPGTADASLWDDLWLRRDQQAYQDLTRGAPERAAARFEDPAWRAVALYRSGEYERARAAFAAQPADTNAAWARFNEGNALARIGDYQGAIARYDAVLALDPEHDDARFNRELMQKLLAEQAAAEQSGAERQAPRDGESGEGSGPPQEPDGGSPEGQPGADADGSRDEGAEDSGTDAEQEAPGESQASAQADDHESGRDADRETLEQWLRRVPDDPGGLLRRKFQYETNQRLRQGEYRARDPEKIW